MQEITQKIKDRMDEMGITKYRLSKLTGISEAAIGRFLNNESDMLFSNVLKILQVVKGSIDI